MIHLDTSFIVDLIRESSRQRGGPATAFLATLPKQNVRVSVFVSCELMVGVRLSKSAEQEREKVHRICAPFQVIYPDERFPEVYGEVLSDLRRRRLNVDTMDLLIGTAALVDTAQLVTGNVKHFSHISNLEVLTYKSHDKTIEKRPERLE